MNSGTTQQTFIQSPPSNMEKVFLDSPKILSIATLGYYFYESMTLTNMIQHVLPKLNNYGFDLLFFHNIMDNSNINIVKYPIDMDIYSNIDIKGHNLAIHPF